eukprot:883071-Rhodomonas_salina.1
MIISCASLSLSRSRSLARSLRAGAAAAVPTVGPRGRPQSLRQVPSSLLPLPSPPLSFSPCVCTRMYTHRRTRTHTHTHTHKHARIRSPDLVCCARAGVCQRGGEGGWGGRWRKGGR